MIRLLLLFITVVGFLALSSILAESSATSNTTFPELSFSANASQLENSTLTDTSNGCCTPILLAPIATSGNNVYLVWTGNDTGHLEIMFRASSDNAQTFRDKINLSNTPNVDSIDMQIATSGSYVYISWWEDYGNGTRTPFFRASNDNGQTFGPVLSPSENGPLASETPIAAESIINSGY
ncbi:MAG TPA: hypothetical protein VFS97_04025 [Nitrososphaeraceae archaeon]|nr:hypothetical protein [Nitrososphaeraceae archaeon]